MEKNWISELKEKSWEIEILISGGAIFSLLQLTDFLIPFFEEWKIVNPTSGLGIIQLISFLGAKILTVGFAFHLLARGYWLSLLCLDYVAPSEDISQVTNRFAKPFSNITFKLYDHQTIDKFCGILMYLSITYSVATFGLAFLVFATYTGPIFLLQRYTGLNAFELNPILTFLFNAIAITIFVYVIDFLTWRISRRVKYLSFILFPVFYFYDFISLRFLYASSFSILIKKVSTIQFASHFIVFIFLSSIFTYTSLEDILSWPRLFDARMYKSNISNNHSLTKYYRDESDFALPFITTIQSRTVVKQNEYLEIQINYSASYDRILKFQNQQDTPLGDLIVVSIDDSVYQYKDWTAMHTLLKNEHFLLGMIDVSHLDNGKHLLKVYTKKTMNESLESNKVKINIPFWIK